MEHIKPRTKLTLELLISLIIFVFLSVQLAVSLLTLDKVNNPQTETKTKVVHIKAPTTTTIPWTGVQCMVNGTVVHTDLAHAQEAGCQ